MKIEVLKLKRGPVRYDAALTPEFLALDCDEELQFEPATGSIEFRMVGSDILASGELQTRVTLPCVRCLTPTTVPLKIPVHLYYWPKDAEREESSIDDIQPNEPDYAEYEGEFIDPDEELREIVLVEVPPFPLCKEECQGLCTHCGANLNEETCGCAPEEDEPPPTSQTWKDQIKNIHLDD